MALLKTCHSVWHLVSAHGSSGAVLALNERWRAAVTGFEETALLHSRTREELLKESLMCLKYLLRINLFCFLHLNIPSLQTTDGIETRIHFILLLRSL